MSDAEDALVRAYFACNLALESLADLPAETRAAVEEPIREFCSSLEPSSGIWPARSKSPGQAVSRPG